jgi:hypothetical protein
MLLLVHIMLITQMSIQSRSITIALFINRGESRATELASL